MLKNLIRKILRRAQESQIEMLVRCGLELGNNVYIENDVVIDPAHCWLISIGDDSTLAPRVYVLAHDASTRRHIGYTKIAKTKIGKKTFIGAGCFILPGVTIGDNVVIGAGSVVTHDIPDNTVAIGNPAKVVCSIEEYIGKNKQLLEHRPKFPHIDITWDEFVKNGGIPEKDKELQKQLLEDGFGFVV